MSAAAPAPPARLALRAGPLELDYEAGGVRHVRCDGHEVIRRLYAAVRDHNWGTVPGVISGWNAEVTTDAFRLAFTSTHRRGEVHFVWQGVITGGADGAVTFTFNGEARSAFRRNRIGFCVLHPIPDCAGARCRTRGGDGAERELRFPELVAAEQPVPGLHDLAALAHEVAPGLWAELAFAGDVFETEDQRNWIDASFKTYCTPLRLPFPVGVPAGTRVRQEVRLQLVDSRTKSLSERAGAGPTFQAGSQGGASAAPDLWPGCVRDAGRAPVEITVTDARRPLPEIGLGVASHGRPLTPREVEKLSLLMLWHLRADVRLGDAAWPAALRLACDQSGALGVPLELAVHLPRAGGGPELDALAGELRRLRADLARVLLFRDGEKTLTAAGFRLAKAGLAGLGAPLGAGTDADFYQLNQQRPPHAEADFIHWAMNPQVHAEDDASLRETPLAIPAQLASAAAYFPGRPLVVSPVTLRPRFNPVATGPAPPVPPGEPPPQVDPRQASFLAAGWTLAVLKRLAESGAESVTLYETTGWRGVLETEQGPPLPERFPSRPGQVFPLFHVIGAVNGFGRGEVIVTRSGDPRRVESLALTKKDRACLWLANLTGEDQTAIVRGFRRVTHRTRVPWELPQLWTEQPEVVLRDNGPPLARPAEGEIEVRLEPWGLHRLELDP